MTQRIASRTFLRLLGSLMFVLPAFPAGAVDTAKPAFIDPLDAPSLAIPHPEGKPMMAVALAGVRLVGVGMRGLIVYSDDGGVRWQQATSPVQSDLTGVTFIDAKRGWAVGHDGVILATTDGGRNWVRQFDGRLAAKQFTEHYRARVQAGEPGAQKLLDEVERDYQHGPALPFLDVAFDDALHGFAVGPFGMIVATQDGGHTWQPWLERVDNPDLLSFYAAHRIGRELYLVGERGTVYRLDRDKAAFTRMATGYAGSLFGIVGNDRMLVAYGLRGTVTISTDAGASWTLKSLPMPAGVTGATLLDDGRVVLANIAGTLWINDRQGAPFSPLASDYAAPVTALQAFGTDSVAVAGLRGMAVQHVAPAHP